MTYDTTGDACTLDDVNDALAYVDADDRDTWLQMGMAMRAEFGDDGFSTWDDWSQQSGSYRPRDAKASWKSFRKRGIGIGTLFKAALDNGWRPKKTERSADDLQRLRAEQAERRRLQALRAEQEVKTEQILRGRVAELANVIWPRLQASGESAYLVNKQIDTVAHGGRFVHYGFIVITDTEQGTVELIRGSDNISAFYKTNPRDNKPDHLSIHHYKQNYLAVPMRDETGALCSLQFITPTGAKLFMTAGQMSGTFHLMGEYSPRAPVCVAEGFATAASIYQATGWPVAVAWNAHNLKTVSHHLRAMYPNADIFVCGDDDSETKGNPGKKHASDAAGKVSGRAIFPAFLETV